MPVCDVILPVLGRPHAAAPFTESLRASCDDANLIVVAQVDDPDTAAAWEPFADVLVVSPFARTFAEKVNDGYTFGAAPWVLLVGDDARFVPGWLGSALVFARTASVIGTNDEANRRVMQGHHSCHPLISRHYIDTEGASWDGPGVVCHPGYHHNYVDDEIVTVARQRDVWAFAPLARIHHLHPAFGTAPNDATYRKGREHINEDRLLFRERSRTLGGVSCILR